MLSLSEIKRSLYGAWRLFCGDAKGLDHFGLTAAGFLRSFLVFILIAPIYALSVATENGLLHAERQLDDDFSDGRFFLARALTFLIDWVAFPIVMVFVTRQLKLGHRYAAFITVRNWTALPAAALTSLPAIAYGVGLLPITATTLATFIFLIIVLRYGWFVARTTLATTAAIAAGLVALDLVLSLAIGRVGDIIAGL